MPIYKYKATDKYGISFVGRISASNTSEVIQRLKRKKIMPISITQLKTKKMSARKPLSSKKKDVSKVAYKLGVNSLKEKVSANVNISFKRVKPFDVIVFTQNLYSLKKANFNNVHALSTLLQVTENATLANIIEDILNGVEAGHNMYTIMEYYPDVFPAAYVGIIKSGELSGSLVNSLEQARNYIESSTNLKNKLRSILLPNIAQFLFIVILLVAGVIFLMPQIDNIYASFGLTDNLPEATKVFSAFVNGAVDIWYIIVGVIVAILVVFILYINTMEGRFRFDYFKYKVPIFGALVVAIDFKKFLNALKLNLLNGMRLQEALDLAKEVVKNTVLLSLIESGKNNLIRGDDWVEPFDKAGVFPNMAIEMLRMGMDTDLVEMVEKIENYMEIEIDRKLNKTIKVLPELSYAFVGIVIVVFVIVIMVPIMEVYMGSFLFDAYFE